MRKLSETSPALCPREKEALALFNQGIPFEEAAKKMGLKGRGGFSAYVSTLRRKGAIPLLPKGSRGNPITELGPPPSRRKEPLQDAAPLFQRGRPSLPLKEEKTSEGVLVPFPADEIDVPVKRRTRRNRALEAGVSVTTYAMAKELDDAIHRHVQEGKKLDSIHRWCIVLVGTILGGNEL